MSRFGKILIVISFIFIVFIGLLFFFSGSRQGPEESPASATNKTMKIESPSFQNNQPITKKYACDGEDINTPLVFIGVPSEAKSLVGLVEGRFNSGLSLGSRLIKWIVFGQQEIFRDSR